MVKIKKSPHTLYGEELAKRKGFKSRTVYITHLAQQKGFSSIQEERDFKAREKGFKSHSDMLNVKAREKGFISQSELIGHQIKQKISKKEKESEFICETLESIIKNHPDVIDEIFYKKSHEEINNIKRKIKSECKSKLLSELLD